MPRVQPSRKAKEPTTTRRKGKQHRIAPTTPIRRPLRSPTPLPEDEYRDTTDVKAVTGPVNSFVHESMVDGWRINENHSMWLIFDVINPVRQFKRGMEYDDKANFPAYGPEPWDDLTETDDPSPGLMPFAPIAYSSKHKIKCNIDYEKFMSWKPGELRDVEIGTARKLSNRDAYRTKYTRRQIPAPYDRIVCQLLSEDRHGNSHKSHESLRRQSYARRVLDKFVEELREYTGPPAAFRSYVLSPILARQLVGTPDCSSISIRECVAEDRNGFVSIGEATTFYLGEDLTDPELIPQYRINMLSTVEAMWHLAVVMGVVREHSSIAYNNFHIYYDCLMEDLKVVDWIDGDWGDEAGQTLLVPEIEMILSCQVQGFFEQELEQVPDLVAAVKKHRGPEGKHRNTPTPRHTTAGRRLITTPPNDPEPSSAGPATAESSTQPPNTHKRTLSGPSTLPQSPRATRRSKRIRTQGSPSKDSKSPTSTDEDSSLLTSPAATSDEPGDDNPDNSTDSSEETPDETVTSPEPTMGMSQVPETEPNETSDDGPIV